MGRRKKYVEPGYFCLKCGAKMDFPTWILHKRVCFNCRKERDELSEM